MDRAEIEKKFQRYEDLIRYCRHDLHEKGLITDEEFADLVNVGSVAARLLEGYDEVQARLSACAKERKRLSDALTEASREHERKVDGWMHRLRGEEDRHAALQSRCYEGFASATDGIFDALSAAESERDALREKLTKIETVMGWAPGAFDAATEGEI